MPINCLALLLCVLAAAAPRPSRGSFMAALEQVLMWDHDDLRDGSWILRSSGVDLPAVVAELAKTLQDPDVGLRRQAAEVLGEIGEGGSAAAPDLIDALLYDRDVDVRWACARALGKMGASGAVIPLIGAAADPDPYLRAASAWALGRIAGQDALRRRALGELLSDTDPEVAACAREALRARTLPGAILDNSTTLRH